MQKELEEIIKGAELCFNSNSSIKLADGFYYKINVDNILALDGKIKTKREELLIKLGEATLRWWDWNQPRAGNVKISKHTNEHFSIEQLDSIVKLKELEK